MKPFENWNPKSSVLVGAALGAGVLLLLAAVPSQTDFDGAYFKTNSLPISLTGYLTNWAKLDTNASGGDTIWTTNADGVISPLGNGQLTNTLRFSSGITNNSSTNKALIVDTTDSWSKGMLESLHNHGTNVAWITAPSGGIYTGRDADFFWDTTSDDNILTMVRHDTAGDLPSGFVQTAVISGTGGSRTDVVKLETYDAGDAIYDVQWGIGINGGFFVGLPEYFQSSVQGDTFSDIRFVTGIFGPDTQPLYIRPNYGGKTESINVAYKFGTSQVVTNNYLMKVLNAGTNMVSVDYEGAITTGGNTNRWIFASYDNSKANVTVEGNAHALLSDETPVVNGNLGAALSVGDTTFVNMLKASQTNSIASAMTFSYATNGLDLIEFTHVRTFLNGSGSDQTVNLPSGWHKGQGAGSSFVVTNATLAKLYVTCMGPTSSAALQTNVTATVSFFP